MKPNILIVEDEPAIQTGLIDALAYHGYHPVPASDGKSGLEIALNSDIHLVLLDVMLPKMNGFDVCNAIRKVKTDLPVIMLTAKSEDTDIIHGLSLGADDYVTKPFSVAQLMLRIKAVLRRYTPYESSQRYLEFSDGLIIDIVNLSGKRDGHNVEFTKREMTILQYLLLNVDTAISREELLKHVWGYHGELALETRTVDIHIAKLRRKIEVDAKNPKHLLTVRGAGYRLNI